MEKRLIVTRADEGIAEMIKITHPIMKWYAKKCKADFKILSNKGESHPHYRIVQMYDLFDEYDRIAIIDSDTLILKKCPDIFEVVPKDKIGSIYEDRGSRQIHRRNLIKAIQEERGSVSWTEGYINSGCFICSKEHKEILNFDTYKAWMDFGLDDIEICYHIHRLGYEIHELPCTFNLMSMFLEPWCDMSKGDAYILHYAGNGLNPDVGNSREDHIYQDYLILKRYDAIYGGK